MNTLKRISLVFLLILLGMSSVSAQTDEVQTEVDASVKPFSHLSAGLEFFSTTGFGLEIAVPLSSHFALRGGFSMLPSFSGMLKTDFSAGFDPNILSTIDAAILAGGSTLRSELDKQGLQSIKKAGDINDKVYVTPSLGFVNGKLLVDFFPRKNGSFHLTAGLYIGKDHLVKVEGKMDESTQKVIKVLGNYDPSLKNLLNGPILEDYPLSISDMMQVDVSLSTNRVKPYFGLGFGRAVPKGRVSFCTELGVLYQGAPKFTSSNPAIRDMIDTELEGVSGIMKKLSLYPVLSFRVNVKLF